MAISYFKDIYNYLSNKYPGKKVYVISDQHFYHGNIINYIRPEFSSVEDMNEHIILKHNEVVRDDDIVIFLGDFCFKNSAISDILKRLKGHKFLLLGNHDGKIYKKRYDEMGFEDVFVYPVKFLDTYLSHYPLLGEKKDETQNAIYYLFEREFKKSDSINYYGHVHDSGVEYNNSVNVTVEHTVYEPKLIGYTSVNKRPSNEFLMDSNKLKHVLETIRDDKNISEDLLLLDLVYSRILEILSNNPYVFFNGSFSIYKKHGFISKISDLDAQLYYDESISKKGNYQRLKDVVDLVFDKFKDLKGFNLNFYKKMVTIQIVDMLYLNRGIMQNMYFDISVLPGVIYRSSDFVITNGESSLEKLLNKSYEGMVDTSCFPKFSVRLLNDLCDLSNLILQYYYQDGFLEKKQEILKKIRFISKKIKDFSGFEDTMIRLFVRNILFFYTTRRKNDVQVLKDTEVSESDLESVLPSNILPAVESLFTDSSSEFNYVRKRVLSTEFNYMDSICSEVLKSRNIK